MPTVEEKKSYVKNSQHFLRIISGIKVKKEDILASFDVTSLFTNIPYDEVVNLIKD